MTDNLIANNSSWKVNWVKTIFINVLIFIIEFIAGIILLSLLDSIISMIFNIDTQRVLVLTLFRELNVATYFLLGVILYPIVFIAIFHLILLAFKKNTFKYYK